MATLDILDAERRTYAEEISDERRQRVVLQAQLRTARAERAAMEEERDSLREAVLHLIEKGTPCVAQKKTKNTLLTFQQSKYATITVSGHTADSRRPVSPV